MIGVEPVLETEEDKLKAAHDRLEQIGNSLGAGSSQIGGADGPADFNGAVVSGSLSGEKAKPPPRRVPDSVGG